MTTKLKYIVIAVLLFAQYSCNDWLNLLPENGLVRDEFYKQKEDVEAVLMAAYDKFASQDKQLFLLGELRADLLSGGTNQNARERNIMDGNIFPDNAFCKWDVFYEIINLSNEVIKNAPLVQAEDKTFTDYQMYSLMAEAYFLRSLSYFYLVRVYGDVPMLLEPVETDAVDFYIGKSKEQDILNQIVEDLSNNRAFAPSGSFALIEDNKGRASKAAYDALLADIELWRFNYEEVLKHVEKIENNEDIILMPGDRWFEMYYPGNSFEGIFEIQFDPNLGARNSLFGMTIRSNNEAYRPSPTALEMFAIAFDSKEPYRGENSSIVRIGEGDYVIWKYVGQSSEGTSTRGGNETQSANWIVYRLADVLLMKAEALAMLNRYDESLTVLNELRVRAGVSALSLANNPVAFEDAIIQERALELAFEGKRWFDLLRMGRRNDYARKQRLIEIIVSNVPSVQKRVLASRLTNPLGWYLPVHEDEIERNQKLDQNPYYIF